MLMLAPKAPGPLADVPRPRCTCTPEMRRVSAGMFTQNTSWDSASFSVIPLSVTLICDPLLPRMVMDEFPSPVPFSLYVTTDGNRFRAMGSEAEGRLFFSSSFPTMSYVTGVSLPARVADTTTESRRSCAAAQRGSTHSAAKSIVLFIILTTV